MANFNSFVSVIIPVYNGSNFLRDAINSALNQSYPFIEVIVVNDGSTDGGATEKIAESYGNKIRYYSKNNGGVSTALNYGIQKARGEIISWLSHDDLYSKDKIANQISALAKLPEKTIVYCDSIFMDKNGRLEKHKFFSRNRRGSFSGIESFFPLNVCFASSLLPRSFLLKHPFDETARFTQDIEEFFLFLKEGYTFTYVPNATYFSRNHGDRVSVKRLDLFEHDAMEFHKKLMIDLEKDTNIKFAKKYYLFSAEKKNKYPVYITIYRDLKKFLIEKNAHGCLISIKAFLVSSFAKVGFITRKILVGR